MTLLRWVFMVPKFKQKALDVWISKEIFNRLLSSFVNLVASFTVINCTVKKHSAINIFTWLF